MAKPVKFEYLLSFDYSDIVVSPVSEEHKNFRVVLGQAIEEDFVDALDYFCQKFYPHVPQDKRPWELHWMWKKEIPSLEQEKEECEKIVKIKGETKELAIRISKLNTDIKSKREEVEEEVKDALKKWPLAWYWKALFTAFPKFLKDGKFKESEVTIRISQIRDWVLVVVYEESGKNKKLLRPPLFGRSERVINWDQYLTLWQFRDKISEAWREIEEAKHKGTRLDEEKAYVIGRHNLIYKFKPSKDFTWKNPRSIRARVTVDIQLNPHIGKYEDRAIKVPLRVLKKLPKKYYPYDIVSIPTFKSKPEVVLLSSDSVCEAYEKLTEIWNDKTTKSVLIIAPPGSGKELFARSIYHFQDKEVLVSYALSPSSDDMNYQMLYSRRFEQFGRFETRELLNDESLKDAYYETAREIFDIYVETRDWAGSEGKSRQGEEPKDKRGKIKNPKKSIYDGLVFQARNGVIFLDEIDKVREQTRASLLRLLENNEFAVYGTPMILKMKEWRPLYVFAGSLSRAEMFRLKPLDFWTRISHVVEMAHPLEVGNETEMKRILRDYFWFFWQQRPLRFFFKGGLIPFGFDKTKKSEHEFIENYYLKLFELLTEPSVVRELSCIFADEICRGGKLTRFSIRNIRSVAGLVRYRLVDYFLYDKRSDSALAAIRKTITEKGKDNKLKWFDVLRLIISGKKELGIVGKKDCENLRTEIRGIITSAIRRCES